MQVALQYCNERFASLQFTKTPKVMSNINILAKIAVLHINENVIFKIK